MLILNETRLPDGPLGEPLPEFGILGADMVAYFDDYQFETYLPGAVPLALDGGGGLYCLELREVVAGRAPNDGDSPVVWSHAGNLGWADDEMVRVGDDFQTFLLAAEAMPLEDPTHATRRSEVSEISRGGYMVGFVIETNHIPNRFLTPDDAATELRITPQRVRQLIAQGVLNAQRVGRGWIIRKEDVESARGATTTAVIPPTTNTESSATLRSLSFFSGAMGLDLGLERAGIVTRLACESDKWARQTIVDNRPDIPVLGDIWKYDAGDILSLSGMSEGEEIDVMAGGPPCQAFSTAGARRGFDDLRGNVFLRYIELIKELRPRYAVIENVRGLLSMPVSESQAGALLGETGIDFSKKHGAICLVTHHLRDAGYSVSFNLYNSANFGTPQSRERVVIIASREGGPVPYLTPTHSDDPSTGLPAWRTVRETFKAMPENSACDFIPFPESRLRFYRMLGPGQYWKDLPTELQEEAMGRSFHLGGGKTGFYRRIAWDRPAPTLVTHPAMPATDLGHPVEDRPLSVGEYMRIQQFPDTWQIAGGLQQQYKQIGNAVPLGLGEAIGRAIVSHSLGNERTVPEGFKFSRYKMTSDREIMPTQEGDPVDTLF